ncbi:ABC transporter permease [candidate division KSB1 bacterium]
MKNKDQKPPRFAVWLLQRLSLVEDRDSLIDDLEIEFEELASQKNLSYAKLWYISHLLRAMPELLMSTIIWNFSMFNNYLKIALRNITKHKAYSFINIAGLAIGLTCCIFISLWVIDELQYDRFHEDCDNLYQVVGYRTTEGSDQFQNDTPVLLAPVLKEEYPDVAASSRYRQYSRILLNYQDKIFYENSVFFVDPAFLQMFSFSFLFGEKNSAFDAPHSIVITENAAKKYFSDENPLGKTLVFNNEHELVVTGVMENVPYNSSLQFDVLLPYEFREVLDAKEGYKPSWGHNTTSTFVQLQEKASVELFNSKISMVIKNKLINTLSPELVEKYKDDIEKQVINLSIVPLKDIRFAPSYGGSTRVMYMSIFSAAAFIVLLTACVNFTNLSTARSSKRAREIGLRKVVGAQRKNLIRQFLGESFLLSFTALIIAVILVISLLQVFGNMIGRTFPVSILGNSYVIPVLITITIFTGFAGGFYPALLLSSLQPVMIIKGDYKSGEKRTVMRKVLVVFQFVVSISLIIGTLIIYKQIEYVKSINLGYDKEHVICIRLNSESIKYIDALKNNLQNDSRIMNITGSFQHPIFVTGRTMSADWDGKDPGINTQIGNFRIDYDYVKTMKIDLLAGRDFSRQFPNDIGKNFIINGEMTRLMGFDYPDAIGKQLIFNGRKGIIVGVVKDFHYKPLRQDIGPAVMTLLPDMTRFLLVRISPGNISSALNFVKTTWENIIPSYPFEFSFLDSDYETLYRNEERSASILTNFAFLAIFIACLGIFGLASYTVEQRTKEIGIRKVFGASVSGIVNLLSKEFLTLVIISNLVAWPLSYYLMNNWLQNYAYRTSISIWTFLLSMALAVFITLFTISFQVFKAVKANPVDSIRYE